MSNHLRVLPIAGGAEVIQLYPERVSCAFCGARCSRGELAPDPDVPGVVSDVCLKCSDGAARLLAAMFAI